MDSSVSTEEVITKLKDEGDFDRLRQKIIRKTKENEELRNNIVAAVKQSAALNREGAENLKPRQLADAIHEEVGTKLMDLISDALWGVIKSSDGMRSEISETVESVYNRLLNPNGKGVVNESSSSMNPTPGEKGSYNNNSLGIATIEREDTVHASEPKEPPGFCLNHQAQPFTSHGDEIELYNQKPLSPSDSDPCVPPGFSLIVNRHHTSSANDEEDDPDVPPGFG